MGERLRTIERLEFEAVPLREGGVVLADGRRLAYTEWGAADGQPIIGHRHLLDAGRRALPRHVEPLGEAGLRLINITRAGLGESSRRWRRSARSDADDMRQLIDALQIERACIAAQCGGTASALEFAAQWPDRMAALALISPLAPMRGPEANLYTPRELWRWRHIFGSWPLADILGFQQRRIFRSNPDVFLWAVREHHAEPDKETYNDFQEHELERMLMQDAYASLGAMRAEWRIALGPWEIEWRAVAVPVWIHHGALDTSRPLAMAEWLASKLPSAHLVVDPERGHYMDGQTLASILGQLSGRVPRAVPDRTR